MDETRQRIVDAAVRFHTTIGPANTSIAGIAEAADVTRLTVYRHFPDLETLFDACGRRWAARHPAPDPEAWRAISSFAVRVRQAISELYTWYRENGDDLTPLHRDSRTMPTSAQLANRAESAERVDALVADVADEGSQSTRLRAVAGHVTDFGTWLSLTHDQGLSDDEAIEVASSWLLLAQGQ